MTFTRRGEPGAVDGHGGGVRDALSAKPLPDRAGRVDAVPGARAGEAPPIDGVTLLNVLFVVTVLFLHHAAYSYDIARLLGLRRCGMDIFLQRFAVGGFIFLSGYKLTGSKSASSWGSFITNRLIRVYPLYLAALVACSYTSYPFLQGEMPTARNFIVHALCLQYLLPNYFQQDYHTLWFVSALLACYAFFLGLRGHLRNSAAFAALCAAVIMAVIVIHCLAASFGQEVPSPYLPMYLTFFALGMAFFQHRQRFLSLRTGDLCRVAGAGILLLLLQRTMGGAHTGLRRLVEFTGSLCATAPLYVLFFKYAGQLNFRAALVSFVKRASSAAFCVFLFHRPIWTVLATISGEKGVTQFIVVVLLGATAIWFVSYWIQVGYNRAVARLVPSAWSRD